ncbi:Glutathione peroxidase 2 [Escovopsis weberi]|uniref:Glutathione peroxidase n=1 Tax=Escovopsis weberi TaxID=150374 RepID=A0A0M8N707_ESCWE|nr:Glutathione peroxidase 2 [Escovopsis weberi]
MASATSFHDFVAKDAGDKDFPLAELKGKVVLVVNTASKCGFTPQYKDLQSIWTDFKDKHADDFVILGFPCNQFGSQEPGSNEEIQSFCSLEQKVTFPVLGKVDVKGPDAAPLFRWLTEQKPGFWSWATKDVLWNFEKFLVGRDGQVVGRWRSTTNPKSIKADIVKELAKTAKA